MSWSAHVDRALKSGQACSIDWKLTAEDIVWNLERVLAKKRFDKKKLFAFYDEDEHLLAKTIDFIALSGRAFSAHGFALVELEISSDSYVLTVIPWADLAKEKALAKKAGGELTLHGPKRPLSKPLPAPKKKPKPSGKLESIASPPVDDQRIAHRVHYAYTDGQWAKRPTGTLRVGKTELIDALPDRFEVREAAWIGARVVLFTNEVTVRGGFAKRPLVWSGGKKLVPAKGLPDAKPPKSTPRDKFPNFLRQGYARTGDGTDVVIWEAAGWIVKSDRFVKAYELRPDLALYHLTVGSPAAGASFFYPHRAGTRIATLREAHAGGKCTERLRLRDTVLATEAAYSAFDGRVVLSLNRYSKPKTPVFVVFHPATNELTHVPPTLVGVRKDDQVEQYGVTAPTKKEQAYLWFVDDEDARRLPWDTVLALPRTKA